MEFEMKIGLNGEGMKKLFRLHELMGGSNVALSEVIEKALMTGLEVELKKKES